MADRKTKARIVKFGDGVRNANLVERDPEANGVERIVGLEHIIRDESELFRIRKYIMENPATWHWDRLNQQGDGQPYTANESDAAYGYEVWMSHKGTMPVFSDKNAFENCLLAVEKCDLFLGLITPQYGSGQDPDDSDNISITHQEIIKAIELNKPRWILAHDHVVFARSLLNNLGYKGKAGRGKLKLRKNNVFEDLRVLDLYEDATLDKEPPDAIPLAERAGNWAQKFNTSDDAAVFVMAQFFRYQDVEAFIEENFKGGNPLEEKGARS